jgi:hypothetical protein
MRKISASTSRSFRAFFAPDRALPARERYASLRLAIWIRERGAPSEAVDASSITAKDHRTSAGSVGS